MLVVLDIFTDYPHWAVDIAVVSLSRAHLSSLVGMSLLVKAMAPEGTLVVVSSMVTLAVQAPSAVASLGGLDLGLALQHQANSL